MTPFDEAILPGELKMFKAFLPFLPANLQKMCAIYIKWMELKATIDYYDQMCIRDRYRKKKLQQEQPRCKIALNSYKKETVKNHSLLLRLSERNPRWDSQ